jgi:hypothetical protein
MNLKSNEKGKKSKNINESKVEKVAQEKRAHDEASLLECEGTTQNETNAEQSDENVKTIEIDRRTATMLVNHVRENLGFYPKVVITDDDEDDESNAGEDQECKNH